MRRMFGPSCSWLRCRSCSRRRRRWRRPVPSRCWTPSRSDGSRASARRWRCSTCASPMRGRPSAGPTCCRTSAASRPSRGRRSTSTSSASRSPPGSPTRSPSGGFSSGRRRRFSTPSAITRLRAARDTAMAAGLDARAVGEISGATAGLAYLRVLSAKETVGAREADSTVASSLLDEARQLVGAGVSPAIDATRSEVSFAAVRTQLEVARNAADRAQLDLLRTLDLPPGSRLTLSDSLGLELARHPARARRGRVVRAGAPGGAGGGTRPHRGRRAERSRPSSTRTCRASA